MIILIKKVHVDRARNISSVVVNKLANPDKIRENASFFFAKKLRVYMFRATLDTFSQVFLKDYKYNIIDIGGFMSKISNVLTMLQLLQSGKKYSISELSNELEVSERMIRVYKEDLEKAGIYIDAIIGPMADMY